MRNTLIALGCSCLLSVNASATSTTYKPLNTLAPPAETSNLTGLFSITSNYMFRGLSISNNLPAFQGGLTYTFPTPGIYLSVWGSNVSFYDFQGYPASVELDTIAGIANSIGENFTYDINIDRYNYPKTDSSYNEFNANLKWYFLTGQLGFSSNVYNLHRNGTYYNVGFKLPIPSQYIWNFSDLQVSGGVGHYSLPHSVGLSSYNDYNVGISKTINQYTLGLLWTDTGNSHFNLSNDPVPAIRGSHVTATVTVTF